MPLHRARYPVYRISQRQTIGGRRGRQAQPQIGRANKECVDSRHQRDCVSARDRVGRLDPGDIQRLAVGVGKIRAFGSLAVQCEVAVAHGAVAEATIAKQRDICGAGERSRLQRPEPSASSAHWRLRPGNGAMFAIAIKAIRLNTAFVERINRTLRQSLAALVRRT